MADVVVLALLMIQNKEMTIVPQADGGEQAHELICFAGASSAFLFHGQEPKPASADGDGPDLHNELLIDDTIPDQLQFDTAQLEHLEHGNIASYSV